MIVQQPFVQYGKWCGNSIPTEFSYCAMNGALKKRFNHAEEQKLLREYLLQQLLLFKLYHAEINP